MAYRLEARPAKLSPAQYSRLQAFELELEAALVAYESASCYIYAHPTAQQLQRLQTMEKEIGFVLVAYQHERAAQVTEAAPAQAELHLATLAEAQAERLHALGEQLGCVLIAYAG